MGTVTRRRQSVDPVGGGDSNDYDYVSADPCNSFDLDGRAKKKGWVQRQCERPILRSFRSLMGFGGWQDVVPFIAIASETRTYLRHKPWKRTTTRAIVMRTAGRLAARGTPWVGAFGMSVATGGQIICKLRTGRA